MLHLLAPALLALVQDPVKACLDSSLRHHEWVDVKRGEKAKKTFEPVIYTGAGHGFMCAGEASDAS